MTCQLHVGRCHRLMKNLGSIELVSTPHCHPIAVWHQASFTLCKPQLPSSWYYSSYFIMWESRETKNVKEISRILLFIWKTDTDTQIHMCTHARTHTNFPSTASFPKCLQQLEPSQIQEPETQSRSSRWMAGTELLDPSTDSQEVHK